MFFFKRSKIVVDTFTSHPAVFDQFPIVSAGECMPEWWKEMSSSYQTINRFSVPTRMPTVKRCDGIIDYYKTGFVIPMWEEVTLKTLMAGQWAFESSNGIAAIGEHNRDQFASSAAFNDYIIIKFKPPWLITEKTGVQFIFTQPIWNQLKKLHQGMVIPLGVLDYRNQTSAAINIMFPKKDSIYQFEVGEPMAHIIPLSEKELKVKTHLVTQAEYEILDKRGNFRPKFMGSYKRSKQLNKGKCPFAGKED
jgi:hypothetical protein